MLGFYCEMKSDKIVKYLLRKIAKKALKLKSSTILKMKEGVE